MYRGPSSVLEAEAYEKQGLLPDVYAVIGVDENELVERLVGVYWHSNAIQLLSPALNGLV